MTQKVFKIKGSVQHYSWGGNSYIPGLLSIDNDKHQPFAEYWLGSHPNHPSRRVDDNQSLAEIINGNMKAMLGEKITREFESLPFLLKILDVRQMLSIQVHPEKEAALKEFAVENEKQIPLTAADRNYKDDNHKPEMMVALSDFWLLHGFKTRQKLIETLSSIPTFNSLLTLFESSGYKGLYEAVMTMEQAAVNEILSPVIQLILPLYKNNELTKDQPDFWAARAAIDFCKDENYDRGIFSIYFFNLLHLKKDEGIFQGAGLPHAYLEGQNVEVMANSDNVLRAGLTNKHIDVAELMKHVKFEATQPHIIRAEDKAEVFYQTPAEEFALHRYRLSNQELSFKSEGPEIILALEGKTIVESKTDRFELERGEAMFIGDGETFSLKNSAGAVLYRVSVPG